MLSKIPWFCFLIICGASAFSQKVIVTVYFKNKIALPGSDTIYYSKERPITWADFKGKPDEDHYGGAVTASGFAYDADINMTDEVIRINVGLYSYFNTRESWKKSFIHSDYHLQHEQHHFDITRLGVERLFRDLQNATYTKDNYRDVLHTVFDNAYDENIALQDRYDNETEHSINREKQVAWNYKIEEQVGTLPRVTFP